MRGLEDMTPDAQRRLRTEQEMRALAARLIQNGVGVRHHVTIDDTLALCDVLEVGDRATREYLARAIRADVTATARALTRI